MAGGITVTHPNTIAYTGNVNRIVITDGSGVQHEVKQVYWCPDGINANLIWPVNTQKTLIMDSDGYVALKYKPSSTKQVSTVGIHTTSNNVSNRSVYIFNDNGLLIAKGNQETLTSNTKYNLEGWTRTTTLDNAITLTEDHIYWIVYNFGDCQSKADSYFQNSQGHYKRLNFNNSNARIAPDVSTLYHIQTTSEKGTYLIDELLQNTQKNDYVNNWPHAQYSLYQRTNTDDYAAPYDGMMSGHDGWTIYASEIANITIGHLFIVYASWYDGNFRVCKCIGHSGQDNTDSYHPDYDILADHDNSIGWNDQSGRIINFNTSLNNTDYLQNLSTTTLNTDKLHYLEIDGIEVQANERGIE